MVKTSTLLSLLTGLVLGAFSSAVHARVPSNLQVLDKGYMHISLEWTDNSSFGDHQVIQRKKAGESSFQAHVRLPNNASYYRDLGLESNTTYT
ncbi:MAG: hypothetical protein P8L44_17435 [Opitutales bacterium]|jgi:hypothetical protein|nr:fibronectin type III domain-containing protein [Opitutales bacterium]MDG2169698.1 hypothetical protein [Opitutales bacterium]